MRSLATPAVVIALLACLFILPFWLVVPVGFAYMVYRTRGRGLEGKALLDRGMAGDAVVTRRWRMRISANRYETMLKYAFRTPDGRRIESRTLGSGHAVSELGRWRHDTDRLSAGKPCRERAEMAGRAIANGTGNVIRFTALAAWLMLGLLPIEASAAFGDCSASGYLGDIDERMEGVAADCLEADRFTIDTPKGSREVRIVYTSGLPTPDLLVMVREIRRGVESSAAALDRLDALAPDDITVWISHLLPDPSPADESESFDYGGQTVAREDGCLVSVYPGVTGRRGLAFTTAHEFFHCVQVQEFADKYYRDASTWWMEGTAEWFSNLALPGTGKSDGFVAGFDTTSPETALTAMDYASVVFFFWLAETRGNDAIVQIMRAMPDAGGETAQQDVLATFLAPRDWQQFAQAYLDGNLHQPGGRAVASSPFPGDIYVWGSSRTHIISADRFVLARAQLEFPCGVWSVAEEETRGTRAFREGADRWRDLPDRIVVEEGAPRVLQLAGFGSETEGFAVTIDGTKDPCKGCPVTTALADALNQCLIGDWELVSGGYGAQIEKSLRETNLFDSLDYPDLHRHLTLRANGRYRQGPAGGGEEGEAEIRSAEGKLWQGFSKIQLETGGYWSTDGNVLYLCEEQKSVGIELTLVDPEGDASHMGGSRETQGLPPLMRRRDYTCSESSLSLIEALPGAPPVSWEYRRTR